MNYNLLSSYLNSPTLYIEAVTTVLTEHRINQIGGGTKVNPA